MKSGPRPCSRIGIGRRLKTVNLRVRVPPGLLGNKDEREYVYRDRGR